MARERAEYSEDAKDIETRLTSLKEEMIVLKVNFEGLEESYIELLKSNYDMVTDFKVEQGKMAMRISIMVFFLTTVIGYVIEQLVIKFMT